ncbi:MAG: winged helix-turn-helix domain-containing protein [Nitrososphaerota archaeon]
MQADINNLVKLFDALSNEQRLKIVNLILLSNRPIHVKGIARELKLDYAAAYRHIEKLREAGILGIHEVGRSRVPYLQNREKLTALVEVASSLYVK